MSDLHPDLFAVCSREKFEADLQAVKKNLPDSLTDVELFRRAAFLVAELGDGHTRLEMPKRSMFLTQGLPVQVEVSPSDTSLIVRGTYVAQPLLPEGARLTAIGGIPVKKMLTEMIRQVSGEKAFYRLEQINGAFNFLLAIFYPQNSYRINYVDGATPGSAEIRCLPFGKFGPPSYRPAQSQGRVPDYAFELLPGNIGYLTYNRCVDPPRFRQLLDSAFTVIRDRNVSDLIIDLRYNGGGNSSVSDELFQFISPCPFGQFQKTVVKVGDALKRNNPNFADWENGITVYDNMTRPDKGLTSLTDNPLRYRGRCYQLISHRTFSSAGSCSWAFRHFGMGKTVGEESGGLAVCFGDVQSVRLPNSGLVLGVSYKKFYQYGASDSNRHGTLPDYEVPADKALDYMLKNLVGKNK